MSSSPALRAAPFGRERGRAGSSHRGAWRVSLSCPNEVKTADSRGGIRHVRKAVFPLVMRQFGSKGKLFAAQLPRRADRRPPRVLPWVANSLPRSRFAPRLTGHPPGEAGPDCSSSATCRVSRCDSPATRISSSEACSSAISALSAPGSACRISSSLRWVAACWRA
jgi:hypothetical protein